jgi:PAS domain S-box-containing protein
MDEINTQKLLTTNSYLKKELKHRKKAQSLLTMKSELNRQLISAVPSILIGVDSGGLVTLWNHAAETAFCIKEGHVIGKAFSSLGINWNWSEIDQAIKASGDLFESPLDNIKYTNPDGIEMFLQFTVNAVLENGQENGFMLIGSDITEELKLKLQLQLSQKMEGVGQMAAGIAHEINTPLQFIGDNIRFLGDSFQELNEIIERYQHLKCRCTETNSFPELIESLEKADVEADIEFIMEEIPLAISQSIDGITKANTIVGAMKDFSHPGNKEKELCDINKMLKTTVTISKSEWKYIADLTMVLDEQIPLVSCLPELNQVFLNIIINATHAIEKKLGENPSEKGQITINTKQKEDTVCIDISDTGQGMAEDIIRRIFDPFFTTKEVGKGSGQGLAISYDVVVNKHQGTLEVESEAGIGTTFFIQLPLTRD